MLKTLSLGNKNRFLMNNESSIGERLAALRAWMADNDYSAVVIPQADPHHSEYVEDHYKLREWFSGFTGSNGILAVAENEAGLWTDSRYFLQADMQLNGSGITLFKVGLSHTESLFDWLQGTVRDGGAVAANATLFSTEQWQKLYKVANMADDASYEDIWEERPALGGGKVWIYDERFAGESAASKIARVRERMGDESLVISNLDDVAWLLNIRGVDVRYNPVARAFVILGRDYLKIFIDPAKLDGKTVAYLETLGAEICLYDEFFSYRRQTSEKSFIVGMRAVRNSVEKSEYRIAMENDGVVWVRFLRRFEELRASGVAVTELDVAMILRDLKSSMDGYIDESFNTIAGYGPHGAIVHYSADSLSDVVIGNSGLLLVDTGTHYLYGTTDMTRTIACGPLTEDERIDYTLVLKGHIDLAMARFPEGVSPAQLDAIARTPLWEAGKDYGHSTGHGVGFAQSVHEGYVSLNDICRTPVMAGITLTDEPGYYRTGCYGIRLENMELVVDYGKCASGRFLGFETLTVAPFDLAPVVVEMLTEDERNWLNNYHESVVSRLSDRLNDEEIKWLKNYAYRI